METGKRDTSNKQLALVEAFSELADPRIAGRSKHDLVEMMVVSVCALMCGVDDFVGIEAWANERIDWHLSANRDDRKEIDHVRTFRESGHRTDQANWRQK